MFTWVEQDQAAFHSAPRGNKDLSNFAKPFLQRAEWMGEIWIKATVGIQIWIGKTWVMTQNCRQAWNSHRDMRTLLQNAPFHIFTHNARFGHRPRLLCVCLRCLFFSEIIQGFRLGLSLGSSVCFTRYAIRALWLAADSPQDEMKREGWLWSLPLLCEVLCLMLPLHFLGHNDIGVAPATVGNGSNTTMRNTHREKLPN